HLRANQDIDLTGAKGLECFAIRVFPRHGISVHSPNSRIRENLADVCLDFFGPETGIDKRVLRTGRAFFCHRRGMSAQVTTEPGRPAMKGERDAAIRAIARFTAVAA